MSEIETNLYGFGAALSKINEPGFTLKAIIGGRETRQKAVIDVIRLGIEQKTFTEIRGINAKFNEEGFSKNLLSVLKDKSILINEVGKRNRWALSPNIVSYITDVPDQPAFQPGGRKLEASPNKSPEPNLQGKFKDLWEFLSNHPDRELDLLLLTQEIVEEAAGKFKVEKQFVWDTIRKLENQSLLKRSGRKDSGMVIEFKSSFAKTPGAKEEDPVIPESDDLTTGAQTGISDNNIVEPTIPESQQSATSVPRVQPKPNSAKGNTTLSELRSTLENEIAESEMQISSMQSSLEVMEAKHADKVEFLRKIEEYCQ